WRCIIGSPSPNRLWANRSCRRRPKGSSRNSGGGKSMRRCVPYSHFLDRPDSLGGVADATIEGFHRFVREQQSLPGEVTLTLVQFNTLREITLPARFGVHRSLRAQVSGRIRSSVRLETFRGSSALHVAA